MTQPQLDDPFGGAPVSRRRRALRIAGGLALLVTAAGLALYLTRGRREVTAPEGHDHAGTGGSGTAAPVMLTAERARRIGVTYAAAVLAPMQRQIRTVGQVTFDETRVRTIAPKIDGWVEQLYVNYTGQLVAQGQPLLRIYSPMLVTAQEELVLAARLERDVTAGTAEARQGAAELLASARRRLAYWDIPTGEIAEIERSGQVRRTLTLRAPFGGYVLEKNVSAGQKIMAGDALYKVVDLSVVWVEGEMFERDLAAVRLGQPAVAEFDAMPGRAWPGRITYVYPTMDPETRTVRVRLELLNNRMQLKPGMYATFKLDGSARANVLSVPRSAVLATGRRSLVFIKRSDGMLEPRDIVAGVANDDRVAVLSGLVAGDTVVASATFLVDAESNLGSVLGGMGGMPGMEISPPKPAPPPVAPAIGRKGGS